MSALVLLIEDDPASLDLMCYLLTAHGYATKTASRGDDGLAMARTCRPELIVCDIHLPGVDGYAVAQDLKSDDKLRDVPLVAVTALAMVGDRDRVLAAGFDACVSKPIDPSNFVEQLESLLQPTGRARTPGPAPQVSAAVSQPASRETLLVIDDTPANLELKRSIFEPFGYRVLTCATAADGLATARAHKPALIITDIGLPDASGFDLLQHLKSDPQLRTIPVVVITSTHADVRARAQAMRVGANRFLLRPLEPKDALREVQACLTELHGRTDG